MSEIIVIGSGIGGLAAACRLAHKGHRVSVYEQSDQAGGKVRTFQKGGYRWDWGPSLCTLPSLIDQTISDCGFQPKDFFSYKKLETACSYFYPDQTVIHGYTDPDAFNDEVQNVLGISDNRLLDYLKHSKTIYEHTRPIFLEQSLHRLKTYQSGKVFKALLKSTTFDVFSSMHTANKKRLKHPKLVQLFDRFATYNGSDPHQASGILNVIPSLEHIDGTFFPDGGMIAIRDAFLKLAEALDVSIHLNHRVTALNISGRNVDSALVNSIKVSGDYVVSNADVHTVYNKLLPDFKNPIAKREPSSSALVFYWGIKKRFPQLSTHNIFFSKDYKKEFQSIFKEHRIPEEPTIYINQTAQYVSSDAPAGCSNFFVMINVPASAQINWDEKIPEIKSHIIQRLSKSLGTSLLELIEEEHITTPRDIEQLTSSHLGALYGTSSNHIFSAFLRHPNFSRNIKNLFFTGGSVHPGGGIPLCLLSAKIVSAMI